MSVDIITGISTVGFPIVAFLLVYWDLRKLIMAQHESLIKLTNLIERQVNGGKNGKTITS